MADSACPATRDPSSSLVPVPVSFILTQSPISGPDLIQVTEPVNLAPPPGPYPTSLVPGEAPVNLSQDLEPEPEPTSVPQPVHHFTLESVVNLPPARLGLTVATDAAAGSSGSAVVLVLRSPESGPVQLELTSPLPSQAQAVHRFGSGSSSCPAINVEPSALSPASPPRRPSPSASLPAPPLLLDPLTALHPPDKAGSSGHASSLSPSPRATQSPPKQTLFSPCVDVFEPGPPNWKEEQGEDEDDVGADESQYRHRRLTGDSGIEVCRCRVDEEDEEEEDQEEKEERMKVGRRGGEKEKPDLHDSEDCPARGQTITGDGRALCNPPPTSSGTAASEDKVVIAMETV